VARAVQGSAPAIIDLIAGRADTMFMQVPPVLELHPERAGAALAVTGARHNPLLPGVPTMAEAALPSYEIGDSEWIVAPRHPARDTRPSQLGHHSGPGYPEMKEYGGAGVAEFAPAHQSSQPESSRRGIERTAAVIREAGGKPEF
jgi:hypothetical protein